MFSVSYFLWIWRSWSRSFTISPSCHIDLRLRRRFWSASFIPLFFCSALRMLARSAIYPFSRGMMMSALLRSTSSPPPPGIQTRLFLPSPHSLFRKDEQEREMHAATVEVDRGWPRRSGGLAKKGRTDGLTKKASFSVDLEHISLFPSVFVH